MVKSAEIAESAEKWHTCKQYYSVFNKTSSYPYITSDNEQGGISLESFFTEDDGSVSEVNFSPVKVEKAIDAIKPT